MSSPASSALPQPSADIVAFAPSSDAATASAPNRARVLCPAGVTPHTTSPSGRTPLFAYVTYSPAAAGTEPTMRSA